MALMPKASFRKNSDFPKKGKTLQQKGCCNKNWFQKCQNFGNNPKNFSLFTLGGFNCD
jgi:hypothetical protein